MTIVYGDGTLYGAGTYGRLSPELQAANDSQSRQTGLKVSVIDERLNHWENFAGTAVGPTFDQMPDGTHTWDLEWYSYRDKASVVKLGNGNIVRARCGNGTNSNRQIWWQTITDPTDPAQWESWSVLYTGTHYDVELQANPSDATAVIVWHSKSDGLYKNNVKQYEPADPDMGKVLYFRPIVGDTTVGRGWVALLRKHPYASHRIIDFYFSSNISGGSVSFDRNNYEWGRPFLDAIKMTDGRVLRVQVGSLYHNPVFPNQFSALWSSFTPSVSNFTPGRPRLIRGVNGSVNINFYADQRLARLSDGFIYLFVSEVHQKLVDDPEDPFHGTADHEFIPVWMRSKDGRQLECSGTRACPEHLGIRWSCRVGRIPVLVRQRGCLAPADGTDDVRHHQLRARD
jgi:hypothetical protein